jgi:hypothetical protein
MFGGVTGDVAFMTAMCWARLLPVMGVMSSGFCALCAFIPMLSAPTQAYRTFPLLRQRIQSKQLATGDFR